MTREARLTQKRLEGEILKLLEGESASLYGQDCVFCEKHVNGEAAECMSCPLEQNYPGEGCTHDDFDDIDALMNTCDADAIPGALAIYMWLEEFRRMR